MFGLEYLPLYHIFVISFNLTSYFPYYWLKTRCCYHTNNYRYHCNYWHQGQFSIVLQCFPFFKKIFISSDVHPVTCGRFRRIALLAYCLSKVPNLIIAVQRDSTKKPGKRAAYRWAGRLRKIHDVQQVRVSSIIANLASVWSPSRFNAWLNELCNCWTSGNS